MISMQTNTTQAASAQANPNVWTRESWAARITDAWQRQIPSIFEVGSLLEAAKTELRHGDFVKMVKADLPFSRSTANKLMRIAASDHVRNAESIPHLPAHWAILHGLTLLTAEQFERGIKSGAINTKMKLKDVRALRDEGTPDRSGPSPIALLKRQLNERTHEIAHLQEQLSCAETGSLFDLKDNTANDIANVVVGTVSETKAIAIADAMGRDQAKA
jgi:hypothetical protein